MKRKLLIAAIAVMAMGVVMSCSKDDDDTTSSATPTPADTTHTNPNDTVPDTPADTLPASDTLPTVVSARLSEVTHLYLDITHQYESPNHVQLVKADTALTLYEELWHWDGDRLTSIDNYLNNALRYTVSYSYESMENGSTQVKIERTDSPGVYTLIVRKGAFAEKMETYTNDVITWSCVFHFRDNEQYPYGATVVRWSDGNIIGNTEYTFEFVNGNVSVLTFVSNGSTFCKKYRYNTSVANPYFLTDASTSYLNLSRNIALSEDYNYRDTYGTDSSEHKDFQYVVSGGLASELSMEWGSVVGKYVNSYKHYYKYTYLPD